MSKIHYLPTCTNDPDEQYLIFDQFSRVFLGEDVNEFVPLDQLKVSFFTGDELEDIFKLLADRGHSSDISIIPRSFVKDDLEFIS